MRPVVRGAVPQVNGQPKTVSNYKNWRADLIARMGAYCCYCTMRLPESPQVEHVTAQKIASSQALTWDNLVLACGACNSRKNASSCAPSTHFLPDTHNTHLAFEQQIVPHPKQRGQLAAIIRVRPGLTPAQQDKAQATIDLCGLANIPTDRRRMMQAIDLRWKYRYQEMLEAGIQRKNWNSTNATGQALLLDCIRAIVERGGFFSVWFDAFHDVPPVKQVLLNAFPGTAGNCFPAPSFDPIARIPGDL